MRKVADHMSDIIDLSAMPRSLDRRRPTEPSEIARLPIRPRAVKIPADIIDSIERLRASAAKIERDHLIEADNRDLRRYAQHRAEEAAKTVIEAAEHAHDPSWAVHVYETLAQKIKDHFGLK